MISEKYEIYLYITLDVQGRTKKITSIYLLEFWSPGYNLKFDSNIDFPVFLPCITCKLYDLDRMGRTHILFLAHARIYLIILLNLSNIYEDILTLTLYIEYFL
jgi:hypothetical protein